MPAAAASDAARGFDGLGELRRIALAGAFLDQVGEQRRRALLARRVAERAAAHGDGHRDQRRVALLDQRDLRAIRELRPLDGRQLDPFRPRASA